MGARAWESRIKDTSEYSWKQDTCGTEGLASAQMLCPYRLPVLYFRWRMAQLKCVETRFEGKSKDVTRVLKVTWIT